MRKSNKNQKTENPGKENPASKIFAVVLSLVLISMTVSANGFWKHLLTDNSYGRMATLMVSEDSAHQAHLNQLAQKASSERPSGLMLNFLVKENEPEVSGPNNGSGLYFPVIHPEKQVVLQTPALTLQNEIWNN